MVLMGAVGLGVYEAHPAPSRSFPVTFVGGQIVYPQFAYPLRHEIVPIWYGGHLLRNVIANIRQAGSASRLSNSHLRHFMHAGPNPQLLGC